MINDEALDVIQNLINNRAETISIYTDKDIYHLEKNSNGYTLVFESGQDFRPDDYGYIIQNVKQLKQFFKSYERISIIETDDEIIWEKYKNLHKVHRDIMSYNIEDVPNFNETECSICLDTLSSGKVNNRLKLNCGHTYHKNCISQIRNDKCPMCRKNIQKVYNLKFGNLKFGNLKFGNLKFGNGKHIRGGGRKKKITPLPPPLPPPSPPPSPPSQDASKQEKQTFIKNLKLYIKKYRYVLSGTTLIALLALIANFKSSKKKSPPSLPPSPSPPPPSIPPPEYNNDLNPLNLPPPPKYTKPQSNKRKASGNVSVGPLIMEGPYANKKESPKKSSGKLANGVKPPGPFMLFGNSLLFHKRNVRLLKTLKV
jgi:hypothetical protein